ncbi:MAG: fibronectin type III domain-containing protein [Candidatus Spechtbacteria bacterium SB0662_bin_43]|uniref:Fibronectin type III domain-containing protein n=1 Tax=Candidatus Spechtbacteria bacterium SB0662_bin_43 TaxID=2604897 RepID=A0A845D8C9_9BACT|nr:fibronectin type III domain-containing protein [Candidatus Spechtbacteria bacterium SB0662_bin_43]
MLSVLFVVLLIVALFFIILQQQKIVANTDTLPTIGFDHNAVTISEGGNMAIIVISPKNVTNSGPYFDCSLPRVDYGRGLQCALVPGSPSSIPPNVSDLKITMNGTATQADYFTKLNASSGTIHFAVWAQADNKIEGDETFTVKILPNATKYKIAEQNTLTVTIKDTTKPPLRAKVKVEDATQGSDITITVELDRPVVGIDPTYYLTTIANCDGTNWAPPEATAAKFNLNASARCGSNNQAVIDNDMVKPSSNIAFKYIAIPVGTTTGSVTWSTISDSDTRDETLLFKVAPSRGYYSGWLDSSTPPTAGREDGHSFWRARILAHDSLIDSNIYNPYPRKITGIIDDEKTHDSITVSWNKDSHADKYKLQYWVKTQKDTTLTSHDIKQNKSVYKITDLNPDTEYVITVTPYADGKFYTEFVSDSLVVRTLSTSPSFRRAMISQQQEPQQQQQEEPISIPLSADHPLVKYAILIEKIEVYLNSQDSNIDSDQYKQRWSRVLKNLQAFLSNVLS